jgi:manganese efflux pump family protein
MLQLVVTLAILLPLALDTLALAAALGIAGLEPRHRLRVALIFTAFEAGMPILGLITGHLVGGVIGGWAGVAGIVFLFAAGVLLLWPGADEEAEARRFRILVRARGLALIDLGLGISVDELTVGFSAGLLALPFAITVAWIAIQAFAAAQLGLRIGSRIAYAVRERSQQAAGVGLMGVAVVLFLLRLHGIP